jgi:ABC-type molybdate transport system permease subunit
MLMVYLFPILTGCIAMTIAALVALVAARIWLALPRWLAFALDFLFLLPLILPSTAIDYGFSSLNMRYPFMPGHELNLWLHILSLVLLPRIVAAVPLIYFCARMGFHKTNEELVETARLQGLGAFAIFWHIRIRLGWPWFASGLALGYLRAFGDSLFTFLHLI